MYGSVPLIWHHGVCMYTYVCIYVRIYIYIYIYIYTHTHIRIYSRTQAHARKHTHTHTHTKIHAHTYQLLITQRLPPSRPCEMLFAHEVHASEFRLHPLSQSLVDALLQIFRHFLQRLLMVLILISRLRGGRSTRRTLCRNRWVVCVRRGIFKLVYLWEDDFASERADECRAVIAV